MISVTRMRVWTRSTKRIARIRAARPMELHGLVMRGHIFGGDAGDSGPWAGLGAGKQRTAPTVVNLCGGEHLARSCPSLE